jgi:four helix bundle protein
MNRFKKLIVWQKSISLALEVYKLTDTFPVKERYNLINQMNRSVVSIASNIAEGSGRNSDKEYQYYLSIAQGSAFELETQLIITHGLNYCSDDKITNISGLILEIQLMLYSLQQKLKTVNNNSN